MQVKSNYNSQTTKEVVSEQTTSRDKIKVKSKNADRNQKKMPSERKKNIEPDNTKYKQPNPFKKEKNHPV